MEKKYINVAKAIIELIQIITTENNIHQINYPYKWIEKISKALKKLQLKFPTLDLEDEFIYKSIGISCDTNLDDEVIKSVEYAGIKDLLDEYYYSL